MARNTRAASNFMEPVKSDGSTVSASTNQPRGYFALTAATYFVELGGSDYSSLECVQFQWSAALAGTITIEATNLAIKDAALTENGSVGNWIQENPSTSGIVVVGAGNSITNLTITAGGTNAGAVLLHLGNMGASRLRARIALTNAGDWRTTVTGKQ